MWNNSTRGAAPVSPRRQRGQNQQQGQHKPRSPTSDTDSSEGTYKIQKPRCLWRKSVENEPESSPSSSISLDPVRKQPVVNTATPNTGTTVGSSYTIRSANAPAASTQPGLRALGKGDRRRSSNKSIENVKQRPCSSDEEDSSASEYFMRLRRAGGKGGLIRNSKEEQKWPREPDIDRLVLHEEEAITLASVCAEEVAPRAVTNNVER